MHVPSRLARPPYNEHCGSLPPAPDVRSTGARSAGMCTRTYRARGNAEQRDRAKWGEGERWNVVEVQHVHTHAPEAMLSRPGSVCHGCCDSAHALSHSPACCDDVAHQDALEAPSARAPDGPLRHSGTPLFEGQG
eukprot:139102-Chlamydomonas_euryale.AAC.4